MSGWKWVKFDKWFLFFFFLVVLYWLSKVLIKLLEVVNV